MTPTNRGTADAAKRPLRIAYVTAYDAADVRAWSGTGYYIAKSLADLGAEIRYVGPLEISARDRLKLKVKRRFYRTLVRKRYLGEREPSVVRHYAQQVARRLAGQPADVVFSPGSLPVAFLETARPIVFYADATFAGMVDFYPRYSNLCDETLRNGHRIEKAALERCRLVIFASDWAARTAIETYGVPPAKVRVVPCGANIPDGRTKEEVDALIRARPRDRCRLLFLGVDWARKGGTIACQVAKRLNETGLETELTVAGCVPPLDEPLPPPARRLGFLSKATPQGAAQLDRLLSESHFLILPSRSECYGVVFCEASSYGVPSLATRVGGITTAVRDGVNGMTFPLNAPIEDYCAFIHGLFERFDRYVDLAKSSFAEYEARLNWRVSGREIYRSMLIAAGDVQ